MNLKRFDYYLVVLNLLCVVALLFFARHISAPLVDVGREMYYSSQVSQGTVFLKDLSSLFPPMAYFINAIVLRIFGNSLNTFYMLGIINSILTLNVLYLIANKFCSKLSSFSVGFVFIVLCIATISIMNFIIPYSDSLTYGMCSFLFSLYFLIKYYDYQKDCYFYLSALFCGFALAFKYEFLLFALLLILLSFIYKKAVCAVLIFLPLFLSYFILFLQGIDINDVIFQVNFIKNMLADPHSSLFYKFCGILFTYTALLCSFFSFVKTSFFVFPLSKIIKLNNIYIKFSLYCVLFILSYILYHKTGYMLMIFSYASILLVSLFLIYFKKYSTKEKIIIFSLLLFLTKDFWSMFVNSYGNYFIPVAILGINICLAKIADEKFRKCIAILIIIFSLYVLDYNFSLLKKYNILLTTPKGNLYTNSILAKNTEKLLNFIDKNTNKSDTILIAPTGHIINFLADRKTIGLYNYITPDYLSVFNENNVVEYLKHNKPEYFVLTNNDLSESFIESYLCKDYGLNVCKFINNNYTHVPLEQTYLDDKKDVYYVIYKLKDF